MASMLNFGALPVSVPALHVDYNSLTNDSSGTVVCARMQDLPPEIANEVRTASATINFADQNSITNYGVACQSNLSSVSNQILANAKTADTGEVGGLLTNMVKGIKDIDVSDLSGKPKKGFFGFIKKITDPIDVFMIKQKSVSENIEAIAKDLDKKRTELLQSVNTLDQMYNSNLEHFKSLQVYIYAGFQQLEIERSGRLKELENIANTSKTHEDIQVHEDYRKTLDRFEKRLSDMVMNRHIALLTGPSIRMMQNNASTLAEEIQNSILNVIPSWKTQMVLAIEGYKARKAVESQKLIKDTVNDLYAKNAEMLKTTTIEVAKIAQSGVIEFDTVVKMQESLISSIEAVKQIEAEGAQKRKEQVKMLQQKEAEFNAKLMQTITK